MLRQRQIAVHHLGVVFVGLAGASLGLFVRGPKLVVLSLVAAGLDLAQELLLVELVNWVVALAGRPRAGRVLAIAGLEWAQTRGLAYHDAGVLVHVVVGGGRCWK